MIEVGYTGPDVRADVRLVAEPADAFSFTFESSVAALYGELIVRQVEAVATEWGRPALRIHAEDSGALPFAWRARLSALFAQSGAKAPEAAPRYRTPNRDRLRRSRLYVPGDTPKLLLNATLCPADAMVFDLEDSVPVGRKASARWMVREALQTLDFGASEVCVRLNAGEAGIEEAEFLASAGVEAFWLPKCGRIEDVLAVSRSLDKAGSAALLVLLIESATGVENVIDLLRSSDRVVAVSLGVEDYLQDLGVDRTEGQAESAWARGRVLNAAVASGVMPLASVYPGFDDLAPVTAYARSARAAGYRGVGCIHPSQVEAVHRGFTPTAEEVVNAKRVAQAFEEAGRHAVALDGRMIDEPVYRRAVRTLALAEGETP